MTERNNTSPRKTTATRSDEDVNTNTIDVENGSNSLKTRKTRHKRKNELFGNDQNEPNQHMHAKPRRRRKLNEENNELDDSEAKRVKRRKRRTKPIECTDKIENEEPRIDTANKIIKNEEQYIPVSIISCETILSKNDKTQHDNRIQPEPIKRKTKTDSATGKCDLNETQTTSNKSKLRRGFFKIKPTKNLNTEENKKLNEVTQKESFKSNTKKLNTEENKKLNEVIQKESLKLIKLHTDVTKHEDIDNESLLNNTLYNDKTCSSTTFTKVCVDQDKDWIPLKAVNVSTSYASNLENVYFSCLKTNKINKIDNSKENLPISNANDNNNNNNKINKIDNSKEDLPILNANDKKNNNNKINKIDNSKEDLPISNANDNNNKTEDYIKDRRNVNNKINDNKCVTRTSTKEKTNKDEFQPRTRSLNDEENRTKETEERLKRLYTTKYVAKCARYEIDFGLVPGKTTDSKKDKNTTINNVQEDDTSITEKSQCDLKLCGIPNALINCITKPCSKIVQNTDTTPDKNNDKSKSDTNNIKDYPEKDVKITPMGQIYKINSQNMYSMLFTNTQNETISPASSSSSFVINKNEKENYSISTKQTNKRKLSNDFMPVRNRSRLQQMFHMPQSKNTKKELRDTHIQLYNRYLKSLLKDVKSDKNQEINEVEIKKSTKINTEAENLSISNYSFHYEKESNEEAVLKPNFLEQDSIFSDQSLFKDHRRRNKKKENKFSELCSNIHVPRQENSRWPNTDSNKIDQIVDKENTFSKKGERYENKTYVENNFKNTFDKTDKIIDKNYKLSKEERIYKNEPYVDIDENKTYTRDDEIARKENKLLKAGENQTVSSVDVDVENTFNKVVDKRNKLPKIEEEHENKSVVDLDVRKINYKLLKKRRRHENVSCVNLDVQNTFKKILDETNKLSKKEKRHENVSCVDTNVKKIDKIVDDDNKLRKKERRHENVSCVDLDVQNTFKKMLDETNKLSKKEKRHENVSCVDTNVKKTDKIVDDDNKLRKKERRHENVSCVDIDVQNTFKKIVLDETNKLSKKEKRHENVSRVDTNVKETYRIVDDDDNKLRKKGRRHENVSCVDVDVENTFKKILDEKNKLSKKAERHENVDMNVKKTDKIANDDNKLSKKRKHKNRSSVGVDEQNTFNKIIDETNKLSKIEEERQNKICVKDSSNKIVDKNNKFLKKREGDENVAFVDMDVLYTFDKSVNEENKCFKRNKTHVTETNVDGDVTNIFINKEGQLHNRKRDNRNNLHKKGKQKTLSEGSEEIEHKRLPRSKERKSTLQELLFSTSNRNIIDNIAGSQEFGKGKDVLVFSQLSYKSSNSDLCYKGITYHEPKLTGVDRTTAAKKKTSLLKRLKKLISTQK